MRSPLVFALVAIAAPSVAACAAEESASSGYVRPAVPEAVSYDASESTRTELGVVLWGADSGADGAKVNGYGVHGEKLVTVEQRAVLVDATHHYLETTLDGSWGRASMRMDGTVGDVDASGEFSIELRQTENTFVDSPRAHSAMEHLQNACGQARSGCTGGGGTPTASFDRAIE